MNNTYKRGFTLIELLVVITIIGILATVVVASLNTSRDRSSVAAIMSTTNNMRKQAEIFHNSNGPVRGYLGMCTAVDTDNGTGYSATTQDNIIATGITNMGTGADCDSTATAYAIQATLPTSPVTYYCIDSRGNARSGATSKTASATVCP